MNSLTLKIVFILVQMVKRLPTMRETWLQSLPVGKISWRKEWQPTPGFLPPPPAAHQKKKKKRLKEKFFFPGGSDGKASVYNVRYLGSIPGLGRFPGEGNGNPLQYFLPWKSHGRRSLVQTTIHGVAKSQARLSDFTSLHTYSTLDNQLTD